MNSWGIEGKGKFFILTILLLSFLFPKESYGGMSEISKLIESVESSTNSNLFNKSLSSLRENLQRVKDQKTSTNESIYLNGLDAFLEYIPKVPASKTACESAENSMRVDLDPQGRLSEVNDPKYFKDALALLKKGCSLSQ